MGLAPLEDLVEKVVAGDARAWAELWARLEPKLLVKASKVTFLGRLSHSEDERRNVVVEIMRRLHEDGHRRLAAFAAIRARDPSTAFLPWLNKVARNIAVDYIRAHDEYLDLRHGAKTGDPIGAWVEPVALPSDSQLAGRRYGATDVTAAKQMLSYAGHHLPPDQHRAIELWIVGLSFEDIAAALGLESPREAERRLRAGLERLRRHFKAP